MKSEKITSITESAYEGNVYNVELESDTPVEEDDLFWVSDGILVHNCFPKDLAALIHLSNEKKSDTTVMKAVQEKNLALVPKEHRDWERMEGRAISKRDKQHD